jgi:hypothetical protein
MNPFVEGDPQPGKGFDNILFGSRDKAALIGVLYAENVDSVVMPGKKKVVKGGANPADMQGACGAGRESYPDFALLTHESRKVNKDRKITPSVY